MWRDSPLRLAPPDCAWLRPGVDPSPRAGRRQRLDAASVPFTTIARRKEDAMRPIRDLTQMVTMPFKAAFVVGLCFVINQMTSPGHAWWHWVALGMGIATLVALGRGLRTLLVLALAAWVGKKLLQRYGPSVRAAFDAWVAREQPGWADVVRAWQEPGRVPGAVVEPVRH
jgi:hypothetical protein